MVAHHTSQYTGNRTSGLGFNPLDENPHIGPHAGRNRPFDGPATHVGSGIGVLALAVMLVVGILLAVGLMMPDTSSRAVVETRDSGSQSVPATPNPYLPAEPAVPAAPAE